MKYCRVTEGGYIVSIGTGNRGEEITEEEYNSILATIHDRPTPPSGKAYRLRTDLTWELYDLPEPEPEPVSDAEIVNALASLL